jgi:hypothetical protein
LTEELYESASENLREARFVRRRSMMGRYYLFILLDGELVVARLVVRTHKRPLNISKRIGLLVMR